MQNASLPFYTRHGHRVIPAEQATILPRRGIFALMRATQYVVLVWPEFTHGIPDLPGGGIDAGETPDQALRREWQEETGLNFPDDAVLRNEYRATTGFFAEDRNEFWIYDQTFRLYDCSTSLPDTERWRNPEGDLAGWHAIATIFALPINRLHWNALRALLPEIVRQQEPS